MWEVEGSSGWTYEPQASTRAKPDAGANVANTKPNRTSIPRCHRRHHNENPACDLLLDRNVGY